eukprot:1157489-Pelagomonas_calceolata.AAC.4
MVSAVTSLDCLPVAYRCSCRAAATMSVQTRTACGRELSTGTAALDVVRDVVDLLAVFIRDGGARGGAGICAQHHPVLGGLQS